MSQQISYTIIVYCYTTAKFVDSHIIMTLNLPFWFIKIGENYVFISGSLYYIENTPMTYANAQKNCQEKFGISGGRLFEPRDANTFLLASAAAAKFASSTYFWLGINDLANRGQYVYASDGQATVPRYLPTERYVCLNQSILKLRLFCLTQNYGCFCLLL